MRKIYETTNDRKNELIAARFIGEILDCQVIQNKKLYSSDFSLVKEGRLKAIGEIKVRNNSKTKYDTFFISADKIAKCKHFSKTFNVKFFLFVWWNEGINIIDLTERDPLYVSIGGRFDRNDSQDIEPMAHYSPSEFTCMGEP